MLTIEVRCTWDSLDRVPDARWDSPRDTYVYGVSPAKIAIHFDQVAAINAGSWPEEHEVERARAIVAAFRASDGKGAVQLGGMMLDKPHLTQALWILEAAGER
jgi:citrate lyase beta subunit